MTAVVLAAAALVLSALSALTIHPVRTTYVWGVPTAPANVGTDSQVIEHQGSFTPLLLAAHTPENIEITWTCDAGIAATGGHEVDVFATTKQRDTAGALLLTLVDGVFVLTVAGEALVALPYRASPTDCWYRFHLTSDGTWHAYEGTDLLHSGSNGASPVTTGFASDLAGVPPADVVGQLEVALTTRPHGSTGSSTTRVMQALALLLGGLAVVCLLKAWR
ncbi:MAG: hypothetical protein WEA29_02840 [Acidimicrobiia bacterium]